MVDKIKNIYNLIEQKNNEISNMYLSFITKANELVELSNDDYQVERSFKLNKISLKGFVLESTCCNSLKSNNIEKNPSTVSRWLEKIASVKNSTDGKYKIFSLIQLIRQF